MRKATAEWKRKLYLETRCPYCFMPTDIEDNFEVEDFGKEFCENSLNDLLLECFHCNKIFGVKEVISIEKKIKPIKPIPPSSKTGTRYPFSE